MEKPDKNEVTPLVAELIQTPVNTKRRREEMALQAKRRENTIKRIQLYAPEAVDTLVDIMRLGKDQERLKAAVKLLEYAVGKPSENKHMEELKETVLTPEEYEEITAEDDEEELQRMIEERYKHGKD